MQHAATQQPLRRYKGPHGTCFYMICRFRILARIAALRALFIGYLARLPNGALCCGNAMPFGRLHVVLAANCMFLLVCSCNANTRAFHTTQYKLAIRIKPLDRQRRGHITSMAIPKVLGAKSAALGSSRRILATA
eukprot:13262-Heterococcus_DN1.PRE.3